MFQASLLLIISRY